MNVMRRNREYFSPSTAKSAVSKNSLFVSKQLIALRNVALKLLHRLVFCNNAAISEGFVGGDRKKVKMRIFIRIREASSYSCFGKIEGVKSVRRTN